jgi:hypothetical protein
MAEITILHLTVHPDITLHLRLLPAVHPAALAPLLAAVRPFAVFNLIVKTMTGVENDPAKPDQLFTTCNSMQS